MLLCDAETAQRPVSTRGRIPVAFSRLFPPFCGAVFLEGGIRGKNPKRDAPAAASLQPENWKECLFIMYLRLICYWTGSYDEKSA